MSYNIYVTDFGEVVVGDKEVCILERADNARRMKLPTMDWRLQAEKLLINDLNAVARHKWENAT